MNLLLTLTLSLTLVFSPVSPNIIEQASSSIQIYKTQDYYNSVPAETDLWYLAHTICGEAQNCGYQESLYVGSVVINRANDERFPSSIKEVVLSPGQYTCWSDGNAYKVPTLDNWYAASYLLTFGSQFPAEVVWQSKSPQGNGTYLISEAGHYYCY